MDKYILLIDDKEDFKNDFQSIAQRNGYGLAWGRSHEDLVKSLPELHLKIVAVILDVKCLVTNDQEIENEDFIGSALHHLNREYRDLPRMILTGDEIALKGVKQFLSREEDIYKKEPDDIERLFSKLEEHSENYSDRILGFENQELIEIIKKGEGKYIEYKSSIQYCVRNKVENKELRFEVFKNIAAFANSEGGELLIGVEDNKNMIGLEDTDYLTLKEENKEDEFKKLIDSLIESKFGNAFHENLIVKFYSLSGKTICRITVKRKNYSPVFLEKKLVNKRKYDAFFIRGQASARELIDDEQVKYIASNW